MAQVESFKLDHDKVIAPYVRVAGEDEYKGVVVTKFDIRLVQPNKKTVPITALHTLEHLLADLLRDELPNIIDISPMGCRTGFYMIVWDRIKPSIVVEALEKALAKVLVATNIQGATRIECGTYTDHDLDLAKYYAKELLDKRFSIDAFQRIIL